MAASTPSTATINTLNNPYVTPTSLYPVALLGETTDTPQPVRLTSVDFVQAKAASAEQVPAAIEEITSLLRERHHLAEDADDDFKILNLTEIAETAAKASEMMGLLLMTVAGISLVVGGVGIMNIMLVSVTQRPARSACGWPSAPAATTSCSNSSWKPWYCVWWRRAGHPRRPQRFDPGPRVRALGDSASIPTIVIAVLVLAAWASSLASIRPGRPRGSIPSRR